MYLGSVVRLHPMFITLILIVSFK